MWFKSNFIHAIICKVVFLYFFSVVCSLIPEKQIRVWKEMLLKGLPLYYLNVQKPGFEFFTPLDPVEQKRQDILNDLDYEDYAVSSKNLKSR